MGRPPRRLVTREAIMRAALDLVDEHGAAALSVNRVAAALGVKGPSLYNHISGRDEVVDGIRELIVGEMALDPSITPWTAAVDGWARSYRAAFAAHPNAVPLLAARPVRSRAALRAYADAFTVLRRAGWPEDRLLPLVHAVEYFLLGSVLVLDDPPDGPLPGDDVPPGLEPMLNAPPGHRDLAFEAGLAALIQGFAAELAALRR
ncbi:TetR/AcrR family transcriptional regulator [Actinomadura montaniterrae]|uniref:TetR/AcrR family transcriptional regulator n=1 Tax=Actinomadura montaniterrae TaxID=1803903 RepID=A0A6L3VU85_9ACTN|nr:TetR/AcrR family transcriptional regulator C-terminal domain-containing protein [Actinomadura montaniterrae]KAB2381649.1 TetR/AcrR family transcriptional regulator [Actinomadura montaniterrae]